MNLTMPTIAYTACFSAVCHSLEFCSTTNQGDERCNIALSSYVKTAKTIYIKSNFPKVMFDTPNYRFRNVVNWFPLMVNAQFIHYIRTYELGNTTDNTRAIVTQTLR